jgi:hypothetical protein
MLAFLRFIVRLFLTREDLDREQLRQPRGPLVDFLETERAHLQSLTRPIDRRERE